MSISSPSGPDGLHMPTITAMMYVSAAGLLSPVAGTAKSLNPCHSPIGLCSFVWQNAWVRLSNPNINLTKALVCFLMKRLVLQTFRSQVSFIRLRKCIFPLLSSRIASFHFSKIQWSATMHTCGPGPQEAEQEYYFNLEVWSSQNNVGVRTGVSQHQLLTFFSPFISSWPYLVLHLSLTGEPLHAHWLLLD